MRWPWSPPPSDEVIERLSDLEAMVGELEERQRDVAAMLAQYLELQARQAARQTQVLEVLATMVRVGGREETMQ